ncbi:MAG: hypothetical protein WCR70_03125 [Sphaerochaetaceae bacterium]
MKAAWGIGRFHHPSTGSTMTEINARRLVNRSRILEQNRACCDMIGKMRRLHGYEHWGCEWEGFLHGLS